MVTSYYQVVRTHIYHLSNKFKYIFTNFYNIYRNAYSFMVRKEASRWAESNLQLVFNWKAICFLRSCNVPMRTVTSDNCWNILCPFVRTWSKSLISKLPKDSLSVELLNMLWMFCSWFLIMCPYKTSKPCRPTTPMALFSLAKVFVLTTSLWFLTSNQAAHMFI